jgi:excisionase family DNA binding protein
MNVQAEITELRERVLRLERTSSKPRGRTNLVGAARYLGISDETLRQRCARGEGPRGARNGRFWSFSFDDLDAYAEQQAA